MSQKEKIIKQNSPKVNSEYLTTISSSNYQINQTMLSSNSKENKIRANAPQLKCTCNHPMSKTFQKQQLKCTCKVYKNNNINNMNSYKTESRQSRFDQMTSPIKYNTINNYMGMSGQKSVRSQSYRMDTLSSRSNNSRLVCTCKHKGNSNFNTIRTSSEIKRHINLWGQKTENLQILSAPAPLLTTQYVQNLAIIQNNPKPISVMIPVVKNEISYTNKIEIEGLPQIETKEIIPEKKVEEEKVVEKQEENLEEKQEEKVEEIEKEEKAEEKEEENEQEINEHEENEQEINEHEENEQEINEHEENKQEINEEENEHEEKEQEEKEQEEKEEEEKEQIEKEEIVEDKNEEIIEDNKEEENEEITEEKPEIIQEEVKEEEKPEEIPEVKEEEEKPDEKIEDIPEEVQEEKPEEKPEVKEEEKIVINDDYNKVKKISYTRRIRANIIRVQPQEESEKDSSSASDYDVLQKITKYKGDFKYKDLVNQSLDLIQRHSTKTKQKINIKTPSNASDNFEKLANTNVIRFTTIKTYEPDSKDMQSNEKDEKDVYEVPFSPDGLDNSPDIIEDHVQAPEDSPYPGELVSQNKLEEEKNNYQQPQNNNKNKNKAKFDNIDIINKQDSPIEKQYINMKIEQAVSKKKEINQVEEKSQEQDENNEPREEIKVNIGENNNNENEEHNDKESENENEHDVETYEIEENMDKNENNMGDVYFYNELVEEVEDKENSEEKKEEIKQHLIESQESLEQKDEMPNENEIDDNDNDNIEEELGRYVEEQNNKKIQEKLDNERKKKIKVYNLIENKNLQTDENQEPNEIIVYIKSSVKTNKENNVIIDDNSNERGYSSSDGLDAEPKNSVVK